MGCGRSKFYRKWQPHWCIGGFRKHRFFEFVEVVEVTELKRCPFCGSEMFAPHFYEDMLLCTNEGCYFYSVYLPVITFDKISARIAQLTAERDEWKAENDRLASLLHDINSQLEIATDLGDKRWRALNDIYLNGEKHNANWCKRKAQEGLGRKNG